MSLLSEVHDSGEIRISATEIVDQRGVQALFLQDLDDTVAQAGLISGSRGPGGGFTLDRDPKAIRLTISFAYSKWMSQATSAHLEGGTAAAETSTPA